MTFAPVGPEIEAVAKTVVDAGFWVHAALGPGLLESAYEHCLAYELESRGCLVGRQVAVQIVYGMVKLDAGYRMDLLVSGAIVVEVKSVEALAPVHQAQLLTYLKLSGSQPRAVGTRVIGPLPTDWFKLVTAHFDESRRLGLSRLRPRRE